MSKITYGKSPIHKAIPGVPQHIRSLVWTERKEVGIYAPIVKDYAFRKQELQDLLLFLNESEGDGYWISGPTGSGKTSLVEQVAARLNWPIWSATGYETFEASQMIGQFKLISEAPGVPPVMQWIDGPLVLAMKEGGIFLINEIDLIRPDQLSKINDLLEGKHLWIEETGEKVEPHPMFRFIATANSNGGGDDSGLYAGIQSQNIASMDRYMAGYVDYMDAAEEKALLGRKFPMLPEEMIDLMVQLANSVRDAFKGVSSEAKVSISMSTRTLLRWAKCLTVVADHPQQYTRSLDIALLRRARPEEADAIHKMGEAIFGKDQWK